MPSHRFRNSDDEVLKSLSKNQGVIGSLVKAFLGRPTPEDKEWLNTWFESRIINYFTGPPSNTKQITSIDLAPNDGEETPSAQPIELKSMRVHHFRGFREGVSEIDLEGNLIVVEGKNSSGKTSLAEALEWLLSGSLSRRENSSSGNVSELANCIANWHRPPNEDTWVSATFSSIPSNGHSESFTLRRELLEDYGTSANATSRSVLYFNESALDPEQEGQVLDRYFAGVPPLLMQHTLRDFVQSDPKSRRRYFERLLRIDEITELISCAVITDNRISEFPSPTEGKFLGHWNKLRSLLLNDSSREAFSQLEGGDKGNSEEGISDVLSSISWFEFPSLLDGLSKREEIIAALLNEQEKVRRESFPLLLQLQPRKRFSEYPREATSKEYIDSLGQKALSAWEDFEPKSIAVQTLSDKNLAVSKAFEILLNAEAVQDGIDLQTCPLCAYEREETLSVKRISRIEKWNSVRVSKQSSQRQLIQAIDSMLDIVKQAIQEYEDLLPFSHEEPDWDNALRTVGDSLRKEAGNIKGLFERQQAKFLPFALLGQELVEAGSKIPESREQCESFIKEAGSVAFGLASVPTIAKEYGDCLESIENIVGMEAGKNPEYLLNESIVFCYKNASSIGEDIRWEHAKRQAQEELEMIREVLKTYRHDFLESRGMKFSKGIESVWNSLRYERHSTFSQLQIPRARGVGFPVEIALKALLDDSNEKIEVDALGVFSESQANALGIAASVTRSQLLGHRILIFDDPVQSMDEDHFYTFARDLIPSLLSKGYQIILLTHNDAFARCISYHNNDLPGYVTLKTVLRRKKGPAIEEGNRTIPERLKTAERKLEEGDYESSWTNIRLSIERIYTLSYKKYGPPNFDPATWQNHTAGDMWNKGAREAIVELRPDCGKDLKEIIDMTAAGSHDKAPLGETEIRRSLAFLRKLSHDMKIGR